LAIKLLGTLSLLYSEASWTVKNENSVELRSKNIALLTGCTKMPRQNILRNPVGERVEIICEHKPVLIEFGEIGRVKLLTLRLNNREDFSRDMLSGFDDILTGRLPVEHLVFYFLVRGAISRTVQRDICSKIIWNEGVWESRVAKVSGAPNFLISIAADLNADSSCPR
jgi:hypothetical protein